MPIDTIRFRQDVYSIIAAIPYGKVLTYGQVALLAGYPNHARLVGRLLCGAVVSAELPCHRVVNVQGRPAPVWNDQRPLLEAEGVPFKTNGCVDMEQAQWNYQILGSEPVYPSL